MLKEHEHSDIIPKMANDEWDEFIESVKKRTEIMKPLEILSDGRVIDGRHRLKAALECNIEMIPVIYKNMQESEVIEFMRDSGLRRNLTTGQRAAIVLKCEELVNNLNNEAKERQQMAAYKTNEKLGHKRKDTTLVAPVPEAYLHDYTVCIKMEW